MKAHVNTLLIAFAIIVSTTTLSDAIIIRYTIDNGISVTGLGSRDFVSDLIIWQSSVSARALNLKEAYALIENSKQSVKGYLLKKGVKTNELEISSIDIEKEYHTMYEANGTSYSKFIGYKLTPVSYTHLTLPTKRIV